MAQSVSNQEFYNELNEWIQHLFSEQFLKEKEEKIVDEYKKGNVFLDVTKTGDFITKRYTDKMLAAIEKELEKQNIPYLSFDIVKHPDALLMIPVEYIQALNSIENSLRLKQGFSIDTPEELKAAILINSPEQKMVEIKNIDILIANKVLELANAKDSDHRNITITKTPYPEEDLKRLNYDENRKVSLFCRENDLKYLQNYYLEALSEISNKGKDHIEYIKSMHYLNKQELEIKATINNIETYGETEKAFVYSLDQPNKYIEINQTSFTVYKDGKAIMGMNQSQNPQAYAQTLKFEIEEFVHPVYKLQREVELFNNGKNYEGIVNYIKANDVNYDAVLKTNGLEKSLDIYIKQFFKEHCENELSGKLNLKTDTSDLNFDDFYNFLIKNNKENLAEASLKRQSFIEQQMKEMSQKMSELEINSYNVKTSLNLDEILDSVGSGGKNKREIQENIDKINNNTKNINKRNEHEELSDKKPTEQDVAVNVMNQSAQIQNTIEVNSGMTVKTEIHKDTHEFQENTETR